MLVSICIPTYNRPEILKKLLNSIFFENLELDLFEVCIADNSSHDENERVVRDFFNYPNFHYEKNNVEGFLNSVEALKMGSGKYLKLHNDYSLFKKGQFKVFLEKFISREEKYPENVPFLGLGNIKSGSASFRDFDSFMNHISSWSSWSSAFCIPRNLFLAIMNNSSFTPDQRYPHTSILMEAARAKHYIVDNDSYCIDASVAQKGGYNIAEYFGVIYLGLVKSAFLKGNIEEKTYNKIRKDILYRFLVDWYAIIKVNPGYYTFDISHTNVFLKVNYSFFEIFLFHRLCDASLIARKAWVKAKHLLRRE